MTSAEQAVLLAISELARNGEPPYSHNVPDKAASILARDSAGAITFEEAFQRIKPAIVSLSQSGSIEASMSPKDTWKVNKSAVQIRRIKS